MTAAVVAKLDSDPPVKRYEVTAYDYRYRRRITIGWSDDLGRADELAASAEACPTLSEGKVVDHGDRP